MIKKGETISIMATEITDITRIGTAAIKRKTRSRQAIRRTNLLIKKTITADTTAPKRKTRKTTT
jgi:hypothetical protein